MVFLFSGIMAENINLRICSESWIKQDGTGYDFLRYAAELKTSRKKKWGEGMLSLGNNCFSHPTASGKSLDLIAHQVLLFKYYSKMTCPTYEILLWEGSCPMTRHKKKNTGLLTRPPKENVKVKLTNLFDEFYQIKNSFDKEDYEKIYEMFSTPRKKMLHTFLMTLKDESIKRWYIELRKKDKNKAFKMSKKFFPHKFYFELETAVLHNLEGESLQGKLELRGPEIHIF